MVVGLRADITDGRGVFLRAPSPGAVVGKTFFALPGFCVTLDDLFFLDPLVFLGCEGRLRVGGGLGGGGGGGT